MDDFLKIADHKMDRYKFTIDEKKDFWNLIKNIFQHEEFQKRLDSKIYSHHGSTSLGEHILSDAIVTYRLITKSKKDIDKKLAITIAMFHDLYEFPWQNHPRKEERFSNKHGFIHPLEAVVNAVTWFPEYFKDLNEADIIIDGIIHHMFPFPVRSIDGTEMELNNAQKYDAIDETIKEIMKKSTYRGKINHISYSRSIYPEGRIVARADKLATIRGDKLTFFGYLALITGRNPELKKKK